MKVSDDDLEMLGRLLRGESPAGDRLFFSERCALETALQELRALRKVAEGALALERAMEGIPCECVDKSCEVMCKALREAGL